MASNGTAASRRKFFVLMVGAGLLVGLGFPVIAQFFVTPKSTWAWAVFSVMCVLAGVGVGAGCALLAQRASERQFVRMLREASSLVGVQPHESHSVDEMQRAILEMLAHTQALLRQAQDAERDIHLLTSEVLGAAEQQASGAAQQAASVAQTSATVEELAQTSKQIAENSQQVAAAAESTLASAEEGMQAVADTEAGIEEIRASTLASSDRILALGERSTQIGQVLVIIDDIAEQTKILALNAAIEAARAGEAGRGFAVVAEEIRKLAESVTQSTSEIGRVVHEIQSGTASLVMSTERAQAKVDEGKVLAGRTAQALERIVNQVEDTTDSARQISIATQQQRSASEQVVVSMREMATVSTQAAQASRQIQGAVSELNALVDKFARR